MPRWSTTAHRKRMLCGIMRPTEGRTALFGDDPHKNPEKVNNKMGYFSQRFSLYGDLTVEENISFFAEIHEVYDYHDRAAELLEFTRLSPFRKRLANKLSGGMKQKLALACAIIHRPRILFLDEPTTGVDPLSRMDFWRILSSLLKTNITIIMSTPYMDEAERCGRVALIDKGKLMAVDSPYNIKAMMPGEILEVVCDNPRRAKKALNELSLALDVQSFGDRLNVAVESGRDAMPEVRDALEKAGIAVSDIRQVTPSLENVFISLMAK